MNFGDDPLDILSDGSNDSFFDEPKTSKKSSISNKTPPEKRSLTDIFNVSDTGKSEKSELSKKSPSLLKKTISFDEPAGKNEDWLGLEKKSPAKLVRKISFEDEKVTKEASVEDLSKKDDWLGVGRNKSPAKQPKTEPFNLFEDILGKSETRTKSTTDIKDNVVRETVKESISLTSQVDVPREGRRGPVRRSSPSLPDPLGLFTQEPIAQPKVEEKPREKPKREESSPGVPNWLKDGENTADTKSEATPKESSTSIPENEFLNQMVTQQKLAQSNVEYQNQALTLKQQESQLLMALQLKKYEENLKEMHRKQEEVLKKQEQQFNLLLEEQFTKQQILENNMRLQQERINNHIQLLISQPRLSKTDLSNTGEDEGNKESKQEEKEEYYENLISTLRQRHNEETFLMEESYKKQIDLLEQSLNSVEKVLKTDFEKLSQIFDEKVKLAQTQHDQELSRFQEKLQTIEARHAEELQQTKDNYLRLIEEIKRENYLLVENIKEAKKSETSLFSDSGVYLQKLDSNLEFLYTNSKSLHEIQETVSREHGVLTKAREESLQAKEKEIQSMREALEKIREQTDTERAQLFALVRSLETKLCEQSQSSREDRWQFQQAASMLAARGAALDREADFARASLERERTQLQASRTALLAEQEQSVLRMTEEKLALAAERARLETATKLQVAHDSQLGKVESEAAIQIARETAEKLEQERELLVREKCDLENYKRKLLDQERAIKMRERQIEERKREAQMKIEEGERALAEAKIMEDRYEERMKELHNQLLLLSAREKKLAEEKIAMAKERLELNTALKQNKKCSLCNAEDNLVYYHSANDVDLTRFRSNEEENFINQTLFE